MGTEVFVIIPKHQTALNGGDLGADKTETTMLVRSATLVTVGVDSVVDSIGYSVQDSGRKSRRQGSGWQPSISLQSIKSGIQSQAVLNTCEGLSCAAYFDENNFVQSGMLGSSKTIAESRGRAHGVSMDSANIHAINNDDGAEHLAKTGMEAVCVGGFPDIVDGIPGREELFSRVQWLRSSSSRRGSCLIASSGSGTLPALDRDTLDRLVGGLRSRFVVQATSLQFSCGLEERAVPAYEILNLVKQPSNSYATEVEVERVAKATLV